MRSSRIYLAPPNVGEEEKRGVQEAIDSGWAAPEGPQLALFEKELETRFNDKRVLGVNSGTSALHLALILSMVGKGDEVIIGCFTFAACANVVMYQGAIPVFLDSEVDSWNLDPELLLEYLSSKKKKPKAVIVTHLYGVPAKIEQIKRICDEHEVHLIEDAAEALGSTYKNQQVGSFGSMGIISFNGNKIITTSGGGALAIDKSLYERGLYLSTQANSEKFGYNHSEVGYNYRLSNVLAGLGIAQLSRLEKLINRKRQIAKYYQSKLPKDVFDFTPEPVDTFCNRWLTTPLIKDEMLKKIKPINLIRFLDSKNIESRLLWKPLHLHDAYSEADFFGKGTAERIFKSGLCLPSGTNLSDGDLDYIIEQIDSFLN